MTTTLIPMSASGWTNSDRALDADGLFAVSINSDWLVLGDMDGEIPATNIVTGIEVLGSFGLPFPIVTVPGPSVETRIEVGLSIDGATVTGATKLVTGLSAGSFTSVTLGADLDTWESPWTGAQILGASLLFRRPPADAYPDEDTLNARRVEFAYLAIHHREADENEMTERITALQGAQLGLESTLGTRANPTIRLKTLNFTLDPAPEFGSFETDGDLAPRESTLNKEWSTVAVDGKPCYNEIGFVLASVMQKPTSALISTGAYRHTFALRTRGYSDPRGFTIQKGETSRCEEANYLLFTSFSQSTGRSEGGVTASGMASKIDTNATYATGANEVQTLTISGSPTGGTFKLRYRGVTTAALAYNINAAALQTAIQGLSSVGAGNMLTSGSGPITITGAAAFAGQLLDLIEVVESALTGGTSPTVTVVKTTPGGLTEYPIVPVMPNHWNVYVAETLAGLDAGKLVGNFTATPEISDRYTPVWTQDRTKPSYSSHAEARIAPTISLSGKANAEGVGFLAYARAGTKLWVRLEAVGPEVISGVNYTEKITAYGQISGIGPFGDEEGVYIIDAVIGLQFNATWGKTMEVELVNSVASY